MMNKEHEVPSALATNTGDGRQQTSREGFFCINPVEPAPNDTAFMASPSHEVRSGLDASTLGRKDCRGDPRKMRLDLVSPEMEEALGKVLTYGAGRYGERNWEKGIPYSELYGATRRHMLAWLRGEDLDESGLNHLWHAFTSLGMLLTMVQRRPELDDVRVRREKK